MSEIVGIDLGTTNSGVALVRDGAPQMLPHGDERIIPSVVGYAGHGEWLVGTPARNQYVLDPDNTVRSIKRHMGTDYQVSLAGHSFSPQEISAFVLRELKTIAERNLGHEVTDAVITVPAYFPDAARQATRDAGQIAGLQVRRIINEPTAAALAYGLNMAEDQVVLVYDLGGGTFDVSLVELMGGIVEVRASHGNTRLGGDDFDQRLAEQVAGWFEAQHRVDLRQDRRAWARLIRAAEAAKIELSSHPFAWIKEEYLAEKRGVPLHLEYEVDRHDFVESIQDLLGQTLESIERVLVDGEVTPDQVNQVLLVGGSSRIPAVWEMVAEQVGVEPQMSINPEEAVALGASVQAAIIAGEPIDAILVDVTPYSLGIAVAERRMGRIIPDRYQVLIRRNTTIPVTKEDVFNTLFPDQDTIKIEVYQGESSIASENTPLGDFLITGLEPEEPGELAAITVRFDFDVNGILHVTARDRHTGKHDEIRVEASHTRLSETEILAAKTRLSDTPVVPVAAHGAAGETMVLIERARALLESGTLAREEREALEDLVSKILDTRAPGQIEQRESLLEELLDLLFDLEQ
ncbi:MAG: Hsp70 family protein [Anaerolineae bacterium]|jgi:molecular chaperone DnaK